MQLTETLERQNVKSLFRCCTPLLRGQLTDIRVATWLLPQLVLATLLTGSEQQKRDVHEEFLAVVLDSDASQMSVQVGLRWFGYVYQI